MAGAASGSGTIQGEHPNLGSGPAGTIQDQTAIGTRGTAGLAGTSTAPLPGVGSVQERMNATANSTLNVTTGLPGQTSTGGLTSVTGQNGTAATTGSTPGYAGTAPVAPSYGVSGTFSGQASGAIPPNMSQTQFTTYATQSWDTNHDGMISVPEWTAANNTWFGPQVTLNNFRTWDRNRNGQLDTTEVNNFFSRSNLYASYDVDGNGVIDQSEAARIPVR